MEDFKDKVAFITGGASGIGQGQAKSSMASSLSCPANVNTNIAEATYTRPAALGNTGYLFDYEILTSLRTIRSAG
jgi:hypothetical protein